MPRPSQPPALLIITTLPASILLMGCDGRTPAAHPQTNAPQTGVALPPLNFNRDVRPILSDKCFQCHGPDDKKRDSGLRLDQFAAATTKNAKSGHVPIVPGQPEASEAWKRIITPDGDDVMPPQKSGKSLNETEKAILKRWISEGAKYETHWSFVPVADPKPPEPKDKGWAKNAVDAFILARLEEEKTAPSPEAPKAQLLRRVTLDLTGLPPTGAEVAAFLADAAPDAYEKQVDRLLASTRYGEHMAMGWMDIARYSDTDGFQNDRTRTMWPWRDWVAEAFNKDLPYDDFVTWQIAGDLLPSATAEQIVASGFNRNHMLNNEGGRDGAESRVDYVVDRTVTTGTAFLGLTLDCARCHDHKFDPISTKDVYALSAFFNQVDETGAVNSWGPQYECDTGAFGKQKILVMRDLPRAKWRKTFVLTRGEWDQHGEEVEAATPVVITPGATGARVSSPASSTPASEAKAGGDTRTPAVPAVTPPSQQKDRLALAKWLVAPENPLLARVEANRQWQRFFGHGLSRTPDDFGLQSEYPSHPELLDFLAHRLQTEKSLKKLQRLIVTSAAYRQASAFRPELAEKDPQNRLLARQARFRLPAAVLRDQALAASGLLVEQVGGPPVFPYQPPGMWEEVTNNQVHYKQDHGEKLYRRTLYVFWRRLSAPASLFDISNRANCQVKAVRTNTPLQALALLNDPAHAEAARVLAEKVLLANPAASTEAQIRVAFARVLLREPTAAELAPLAAALDQARAHYAAHPADADRLLKVGEHPLPANLDAAQKAGIAALANACGVILNLDETLTRE